MKNNYSFTKQVTVKAHYTDVVCLALSHAGKMVVTASGKGTVFRIYNTETSQLLKEVRRGTTHRTITHLSFDKYSHYLVACSDADKIHVFRVDQQQQQAGAQASQGGLLSWGSSWMPAQLKDEYSFAYFLIDSSKVGSLFALLNTDYMHVLSKKDYYCRVEMNSQGGELKKDQEEHLIFN